MTSQELRRDRGPESLSREFIGRMTAALWVLCGLLVALAGSYVTFPEGASRFGVVVVGLSAVAIGAVIWILPWGRWPRTATLWVVPPAFALIALHDDLSGGDGYVYGALYFVVFMWLGLAHPQGMSLRFSSVLAVAYLLPLILSRDSHLAIGISSAIYVIPTCVLVGETVAWVGGRLRRSEAALLDAQERFRSSFEQAPIGMALASVDGRFLSVNRALGEIVGRPSSELEGTAIRDLTHPDDWDASDSEIRALSSSQIDRYQLEKRYIHADGHVVWVSVSSSCVFDGAGQPSYLIGQVEDVTERREMRERLAHAAIHDPLTDLPNRILFMDRLELALLRSRRAGGHVAVIFLDLDRFKIINDTLGHEVGDRVLKAVANRLSGALRASDTLARFGGDEFTILCDDVRDRAEVLEIADRLRLAMAQPLDVEDGETFISLSIGAALSSDDSESGPALLRNADIAMYRAKELGPARIEVFTEDDAKHADTRLRTSDQLHRALERQEFELHYQPFVHLDTLRVVATEALIRWRHPTRGLLLPAEFVGLAEDTGLIVPLGRWVIEEACTQAVRWQSLHSEGSKHWKQNISINVSPRQLSEPSFASQLDEIIEHTGIDPDTLWLEITEGTLLRDPERSVDTLRAVRSLGAHVAIDDFGTGYSSLSYLKQLPVESLKIDQSFVEGLGHDSDSSAIVRAVIALADSMGLACIAEGVETSEQSQILRQLGCHIAQGYLFGRALSAAQIGSSPVDDLHSWNTVAALA